MVTFYVRASYSETSCDIFFSEPPTQYQETHSTLNEKKGGMALPEITSCSK